MKHHFNFGIIMIIILIALASLKAFTQNEKLEQKSNKIEKVEQDYNEILIINENNKLDKNYKPKLIKYKGFEILEVMKNNLEKMDNDACNDNVCLHINNSYRSYKEQEKLYNDKIKEYEKKGFDKDTAIIKTNKEVEKAGYSEHQTGLAIDFSMKNDDYNFKMWYWLKDNSYKYGFILRYPSGKENITGKSYEPWHFTYVGKKYAKIMHDENLCMEEYYDKYIKKEE